MQIRISGYTILIVLHIPKLTFFYLYGDSSVSRLILFVP